MVWIVTHEGDEIQTKMNTLVWLARKKLIYEEYEMVMGLIIFIQLDDFIYAFDWIGLTVFQSDQNTKAKLDQYVSKQKKIKEKYNITLYLSFGQSSKWQGIRMHAFKEINNVGFVVHPYSQY